MQIIKMVRPVASMSAPVLTAACCVAAGLGGWRLFHTSQRRKRRYDLESNSEDIESLLLASSSSSAENKCIYLDYNGTTPVNRKVLLAMLPYLTTHFGNPSSSHFFGSQPRMAVQEARRSLLKMLGASSPLQEDSIWFTGCGTESDNLAIQLGLQSSMLSADNKKKHIVTSNVEHPAIEAYLKALQGQGLIDVTYVPVGTDGRVSASDMIAAITPETVLVTLMLANNESGALQPIKEVATFCRNNGVLFHTDAAQACGKVSVNLQNMGNPDMVTLVGHKIGAPKGVAALYVRPDCLVEGGRHLPDTYGKGGIMLVGGGQEEGRRAGTENVPYIAGLGCAADMARANLETNANHMERMRSRLLANLASQLGQENVRANGPTDPKDRLPNTLSVGLKNVHSGRLLANIQDKVAASAGAACHSHSSASSISAVLRAMNVPTEFAAGTLRLSVGPTTTAQDIDKAADIIASEAKQQLSTRNK